MTCRSQSSRREEKKHSMPALQMEDDQQLSEEYWQQLQGNRQLSQCNRRQLEGILGCGSSLGPCTTHQHNIRQIQPATPPPPESREIVTKWGQ